MAMGRQGRRQGDMILTFDELPKSPGHVFYDRLQDVLIEAGFDVFVETLGTPYDAPGMGAPSLPPGRCFRMHLVGSFAGIDSERGLEWRCTDSLSLREFLRLQDWTGAAPDVVYQVRHRQVFASSAQQEQIAANRLPVPGRLGEAHGTAARMAPGPHRT